MNLSKLLSELKLEEKYYTIFEPGWEQSEQSMPDGLPPFLTPARYHAYFKHSGLEPALLPVIDEIAQKIAQNPALKQLAWHCRQTQFVYDNPKFSGWPWLEHLLGENSTVFYLLVMLETIPLTIEKYRQLGIPEHYATAVCSRARGYYDTYRAGYNRHGMNPNQLYWLRHYLDGKIFRIGRFEYWLQKKDFQFAVFEHKQSGEILTLADDPETGFDSSGNFPLGKEKEGFKPSISASLEMTGNSVTGTPVDPATGTALQERITLDLSEWQLVMDKNTPLLDIHIPEGGKMTLDACRESFKQAIDFYAHYFPQEKIVAFACFSWVFYPLYEKLMPESNQAKLLRELYLLPQISDGQDGVYFIFGKTGGDYSTYPRDTTIRRVMLDELNAGRNLRSGAMFFMTKHLNKFGQQPYRKELYPELLKKNHEQQQQ
jgi:hypothetical protein